MTFNLPKFSPATILHYTVLVFIVDKLVIFLHNVLSRMQNVIIVGKWATSKRLVAASSLQGVRLQKQSDRVNNNQEKQQQGIILLGQ